MSANADSFDDIFDIGEPLGTGVSCVVHRCREIATGTEYAVKIIDLTRLMGQPNSQESVARIKREIEILHKVKHPSIISLYKIFSVPLKALYLVFELCTGGELCEFLMKEGHVPEEVARDIMRQVVTAVKYLHDLGIAHRDLKLENILFKEPFVAGKTPVIKLIDFGFARKIAQPLHKRCPSLPTKGSPLHLSFLGTPRFAAPEMIQHKNYDCRCDLYSIGVLLYFLLAGSFSFAAETNDGQLMLDLNEALSFRDPIWQEISPSAQDLIRHLLIDEDNRYTADEFLIHPWMTDTSARAPKPSRKLKKLTRRSLQESSNRLIDFKRGKDDDEVVEQVGGKLRSKKKDRQQAPPITITVDARPDDSDDSSTESDLSSPATSPSISPPSSPRRSLSDSPGSGTREFLTVPGLRKLIRRSPDRSSSSSSAADSTSTSSAVSPLSLSAPDLHNDQSPTSLNDQNNSP